MYLTVCKLDDGSHYAFRYSDAKTKKVLLGTEVFTVHAGDSPLETEAKKKAREAKIVHVRNLDDDDPAFAHLVV